MKIKKTALITATLFFVFTSFFAVSCQDGEEANIKEKFIPSTPNEATEVFKRISLNLTEDGKRELILRSHVFSISSASGENYFEWHRGKKINAGEVVPTLVVTIDPEVSVPLDVNSEQSLPDGVNIRWSRFEALRDQNHPLCSEQVVVNHEGDRSCPPIWVEEVIDGSEGHKGVSLSIKNLEAYPGGSVDLQLEFSSFAIHSTDGSVNFCCGEKYFSVSGNFEDDLRVNIDPSSWKERWNTSMYCGYESLQDVPPLSECPAQF